MTSSNTIIKSHRLLAEKIEGKNILHLNSFGKDSILCLEWLCNYARPGKIVSINCGFLAGHPADKMYLQYLKKRYPAVEFKVEPNSFELSSVLLGIYQSPIDILKSWNHMEYDSFDVEKYYESLRQENQCDYLCQGLAKCDSFQRATYLHQHGLMYKNKIFPIGMMNKKQVFELIRSSGIKLHPCYKLSKSSLDRPSYYKMRATFIASPEYKKTMYQRFPLLVLDEYRWEKLL